MYNLKTFYNNNNNYINNNNNSNNKKNKLVINSTSKKLDDFDDINQAQVSELLKIIKDIQSIDEHNINDDSKSSSSDLSDHSSSLTLNSKKRTSDHKKGSKNKLKQLSSSPTDTPISAPNEINNSTLAALKNDSETNENMRSSIDSSLSDDSLMNEIEYDFKKLISKLDENNDLKPDEEKVDMKNLTNEEEEEETDQIFEFDEEFEVIIKTSNETAAATTTTTTTTNKRLSLSPIEEISTASEKSLSPYLHLNEIPVFYKPDYIKNFNLTKSQYKLIFEFYNTYSVSDNLSNNLVRLAMLECSKIRNDFKATEDDINRIIRIADTNKDEHLNFDQFIELLCLFFSNELNLNSILLAILNNNASNHETKGCLNAKEANQFITYVNLFYGRQFNFMIFNRSVSYDQIASQLGEDLAAFTYF
jgi:hypothetical protein